MTTETDAGDVPETLFVKPAAGVRVPKPDGETLAAEGETVPNDTFWRRRLLHEEVVVAEPPKPAAAASRGTTR